MATEYNNGLATWIYGEPLYPGDWHRKLGPCPQCGTCCFDYGGGWRCLSEYCFNNASNPIGNLGAAPIWWDKGIQVVKDGDQWYAHFSDFTNLQENVSGWGETPAEAVKHLDFLSTYA